MTSARRRASARGFGPIGWLLQALLGFVFLGAEGCAKVDGEAAEASSPSEEEWTEPLDALSRRLGLARQRLRERGYEEIDWSLRLFLPSDGGHAEMVRLRRGVCTTFLALSGGTVRELDLALFDADGRRAAVDSVAGEGSLVHACPLGEQGQRGDALYYLKAAVSGGAGAVSIRAFQSPSGAAAGVEGIFDGILSPTRAGTEALGERLERTLERLRSREMDALGPPVIARVLEGEALRRSDSFDEGSCYVAVARGDEGVRDVVLYLLDPSGAEVARDLEGREEPRIEHCANERGTYVIEARAAEGSGQIGIALVLDPNASPAAPAVDVAAPTREEATELVGEAVRALMDRGYTSPRYVARRAAIRPGESVAHDVLLDAGCSVVLAAPATADMDLDLYLLDEGDLRTRDTRITAEARLATCRERDEVRRFLVKAYGREGEYALVVLTAPAGATDVRRIRLIEATAPFVARGYEHVVLEELSLAEGEERSLRVHVPASSCQLWVAAGGRDLEDLDLSILDEGGRVLVSDTGPNAWAAVSRCVAAAQTFELRLTAYRGAGEVALETMRQERRSHPADETGRGAPR